MKEQCSNILLKRYAAPLFPKNRRKIILTPSHCPSKMKAGGYRIYEMIHQAYTMLEIPLIPFAFNTSQTHVRLFKN